MTTQRIQSIQQLEALGDEWNALARPFASPLLDHAWFLACARTLYAEHDLRIVTVRHGGVLEAVAPLALTRQAGVERVELLGTSTLHEPSGVLYSSESALQELIDAVIGLGLPLVLRRLPAESPLVTRLRSTLRRRGALAVRAGRPSFSIPVRGTWDEYHASLSTRITKNLPRVRARAGRIVGPVTAETITPLVSDVDGLFETVVAIEGSGWKGRGGSALRCNPRLRQFFSAYTREAARLGIARVSLLRFGSQIAAVELSVESNHRMWQLKIGYDDGCADYYPGLLLTQETVKYAFTRRLASYEFLGSAETWEERWRPEARPFVMAVAYPLTGRGIAAAGADGARMMWHRFRALGAAGRPSTRNVATAERE